MRRQTDGGKGDARRKGKGFEDNFDAIFGTREERKAKWADKEKTQAAPRKNKSAFVPKEFVPFVSPIDHKMITCRSKLRAHNKKHGVTNIRDYGENWFPRKHIEQSNEITGNTRQAHKERIENVKEALQRHGVNK